MLPARRLFLLVVAVGYLRISEADSECLLCLNAQGSAGLTDDQSGDFDVSGSIGAGGGDDADGGGSGGISGGIDSTDDQSGDFDVVGSIGVGGGGDADGGGSESIGGGIGMGDGGCTSGSDSENGGSSTGFGWGGIFGGGSGDARGDQVTGGSGTGTGGDVAGSGWGGISGGASNTGDSDAGSGGNTGSSEGDGILGSGSGTGNTGRGSDTGGETSSGSSDTGIGGSGNGGFTFGSRTGTATEGSDDTEDLFGGKGSNINFGSNGDGSVGSGASGSGSGSVSVGNDFSLKLSNLLNVLQKSNFSTSLLWIMKYLESFDATIDNGTLTIFKYITIPQRTVYKLLQFVIHALLRIPSLALSATFGEAGGIHEILNMGNKTVECIIDSSRDLPGKIELQLASCPTGTVKRVTHIVSAVVNDVRLLLLALTNLYHKIFQCDSMNCRIGGVTNFIRDQGNVVYNIVLTFLRLAQLAATPAQLPVCFVRGVLTSIIGEFLRFVRDVTQCAIRSDIF